MPATFNILMTRAGRATGDDVTQGLLMDYWTEAADITSTGPTDKELSTQTSTARGDIFLVTSVEGAGRVAPVAPGGAATAVTASQSLYIPEFGYAVLIAPRAGWKVAVLAEA